MAKLTTKVVTETTTPPSTPEPHTESIVTGDRPAVISLIGLTLPVLNQAITLSQRGYVVSEADFFSQTGQTALSLRLGEADLETVAAAEVAYKDALLIERHQDQEFVKAEALRVAKEQARIEQQRQLATQIAAQEAALKALKAAAAAV